MICNFLKKFPKGQHIKNKATNFEAKITKGTKIHTMREDVHSRWKVGMEMQLSHGARSKAYYCFKTATLKHIQIVKIVFVSGRRRPDIYIDARLLGMVEMMQLASNDGFDSMADFFEYFDEPGEYKLLHWTDFIYTGNVAKLEAINDSKREMYEP